MEKTNKPNDWKEEFKRQVIEEIELRWHNWRQDPDFWKKDIIDTIKQLN